MKDGIALTGLDGSNPLAFLAALGTLRLLSMESDTARLHWRKEAAWQPVLTGIPELDENVICRRLLDAPAIPDAPAAKLGKNLTVAPEVFAAFVVEAAEMTRSGDRRPADFAAAFGSEVCVDSKKNRVEYTQLCFITGSGHQDFVETARKLVQNTKPEHLRKALFQTWTYSDKGLSMRWDPGDAAEYALRWDDPGPIGARTEWGANRLAVEALPLLPVQPTERGLATTGFREESYPEEFTWPLWTAPAGPDTVRSLLALDPLRQPAPDRRVLSAMGIEEVFRSRRVRIGQGANFKVSFRPARSV